mmetsp:Transcript_24851/g.28543  ORF Transcript_24851/g.28543 Transcript_24851/m.28543 type:complete len:268 (-) Transcript_24851:267-1070(-)
MGTPRVDHMLMVLAVSLEMNAKEREVITREMIRGFNDTCTEAGTLITGGQSILGPWPIIGGVANTVVKSDEYLTPNNAKEGDVIVLTKPLGTQVSVNLKEWKSKKNDKYTKSKDFVTDSEIEEIYKLSIQSMGKLNRNAATLVQKYKAGACTDVTGFGILGHLRNLAEAQKDRNLELRVNSLPVIKKTDAINSNIMDFNLLKGLSPETSGGLMLMINEKHVDGFQQDLKNQFGENSWVIGEVRRSESKTNAVLAESPEIIQVDSVFL